MSAAYVSLKKLVGAGMVMVAARHNLREIAAEIGVSGHVDGSRMHLNRIIDGPSEAEGVAVLAESLMREAQIGKLRKDAVRAVEIIVSLPSDAHIDAISFFPDALAWLRSHFNVPVLSAVVHLDEGAPHVHVLLLPLLGGRMVGSDLVGNRTNLQALQRGFADEVSARYGLERPMPQKRPTASVRRSGAEAAISCLRASPDRLHEPSVRKALLEAIASNPEPILTALGVSMPTGKPARKKTFAEIWAKPMRPEGNANPIGFAEREAQNPIGFARAPPNADEQTLPTV